MRLIFEKDLQCHSLHFLTQRSVSIYSCVHKGLNTNEYMYIKKKNSKWLLEIVVGHNGGHKKQQ
jgi:hypothetical protein